jgi:hypothetical protein
LSASGGEWLGVVRIGIVVRVEIGVALSDVGHRDRGGLRQVFPGLPDHLLAGERAVVCHG